MRENRKRMGGTSSIKLMRGKFYEQVEKRIEAAVNKKAEIRKVNKEIADLKRQRRHRERAHKEKADQIRQRRIREMTTTINTDGGPQEPAILNAGGISAGTGAERITKFGDEDFVKRNLEMTEMWVLEHQKRTEDIRRKSQERQLSAKVVRDIDAA